MYPNLVQIYGLSIHTYGVFVAAGFLAGVALSVREARRVGVDPQKILDLCFYTVLAAIVGSRLLFVLINLDHYLQEPLEIVKVWKGGLVFSGGLVAALACGLAYAWRAGLHTWLAADILAPGIALGQALGRIGCFFAGCCYGKPTSGPLGVVFTHPDSLAPLGVPIHPTQLYMSAVNFCIFIVLWIFRKHKRWDGQVICLYVIIHSTARVVLEQFRGDYRGGIYMGVFTTTQLVSIGLLVAAGIAWIVLKKKAAEA